jgi:hypothetical protein
LVAIISERFCVLVCSLGIRIDLLDKYSSSLHFSMLYHQESCIEVHSCLPWIHYCPDLILKQLLLFLLLWIWNQSVRRSSLVSIVCIELWILKQGISEHLVCFCFVGLKLCIQGLLQEFIQLQGQRWLLQVVWWQTCFWWCCRCLLSVFELVGAANLHSYYPCLTLNFKYGFT